MKNSFCKISLLFALAAGLAACSDDANTTGYEGGSEYTSNDVQAYFASTNAANFVHESDDETDTITVARLITQGEATVPVNVEYVDTAAIVIPSFVTFADGESTADLVVSIRGMEKRKEYGFRISIPDEYAANPYVEKDGTNFYESSEIISTWVLLKDKVKLYAQGESGFPVFYSQLYQLEGVNKFYLTDFLGTGTRLDFTINGTFDAKNVDQSKGELVPSGDLLYSYTDSYGYKNYYLYFGTDASGEDVWNWSAGGTNFEYFFWYGGEDYSYIDFTNDYFILVAYSAADTFTEGYKYVYGVWTDEE